MSPAPQPAHPTKRQWLLLVCLFHLSLPAVTPRIYSSDEIQYFAYLRSLWFDRDVSFENEYRWFYARGIAASPGFHETFLERTTETGRRINFGTIGSALLVTGLCLLVVGVLPEAGERFVAVFFGAGAMTLTLYTLHVVMRTPEVWPAERPDTYVWHVLVVLGVGSLYAGQRRRGPLEQGVALASGSLTRAARGERSPTPT